MKMKLFRNSGRRMTFCIFLSFISLCSILTACVNDISADRDEVDHTIYPLTFVAEIKGITNARVSGNAFEVKDTVGLFALAATTSMKEDRYVDNLFFVRSAEGEFLSDKSINYPDDGVALNLISYYPFQKAGVAMGASCMQVAVEPKQNIPANYSHSDFLIAYKTEVAASKEPVSLTYKHKFFKLKIALVPEEGETVESLLSANPQLSVSGFFTKTNYDFQEDSYSGYSEEKEVFPAGEWKIEGKRLIGKQLILIPQETTEGYQYITLDIKGKVYSSLLPSTLKLQNGKQRELEITFKSDEEVLISKLKGEIDDWEEAGTDNAESEAVRKYVDISKLTFVHSNVCKIMYAGRQVAEICKEYLVTPGFSSQAIVVYPVKVGDHKADLSDGVVAQLLDQPGNVQGGHVSWNTENHSLVYTPGTSVLRNYVYVLADGQISLSASMADEALPVSVCSDVIRDVRGGRIHNYPVVKLATQYWMRTNLEASQYLDGTAIPKLKSMAESETGYLLSDAGNYYYSANAIQNQLLSPTGWTLPCWEDWNVLKRYLNEDASVLKSGKWVPIMTNNGPSVVAGVNNRSGFNAVPVGMYSQNYLPGAYEGKYLSYWTLNPGSTAIDPKTLTLRTDNNEIGQGNMGLDKAYPIRCIRK